MTKRETLIDTLANWIDTRVIADAIVEAMEDFTEDFAELEEITLDNAKSVWYRFLGSGLHEGLRDCAGIEGLRGYCRKCLAQAMKAYEEAVDRTKKYKGGEKWKT